MSDLFTEQAASVSCALADGICKAISLLGIDGKVEVLNKVRSILHASSPFAGEPVDLVYWVRHEDIKANDYNPNSVAPPEMELLAHSIASDGYTQPIVTWAAETGLEVIDGFHRTRVGKENKEIQDRVKGFLPVVVASEDRTDRSDRIAATIRHNRARGKHQVESMSDIVVELKRRNWTDEKIGKELGMDPDEVLRLCQITGLADLFSDREFTASWDLDSADEAPPVEIAEAE